MRLWLLPIGALAAYTRLANWRGVFTDRGVFFGGLDSYYHVRRVELTLADFPWVPGFDAWANAPEGARLDWPWLFDLCLALFCRVGALFVEGPRAFEQVAPLFNPLLGVLGVVVVYVVGRGIAGPPGGLIAALLAAVAPVLTGYAIVGRVDHHAAEPLLLLVPLLLLMPCVADPTASRARARAAATGVALAAGVAVWPGALVVSAFAFAGIGALLVGDRSERRARATVGAIVFATAFATMVPLTLTHPWADGHFVYYAPSWLQPVAFGVAALAFAASRSRRGSPVVLIAAGVVFGAIVVAALPPLRETLVAALAYVGRSETQISQVIESRGLFADGIARAAEQYSVLLYLAPAGLGYAAWRAMRAGADRWRLVGVWLLGGGVLAVTQLRFGSLFAPTVSVACGAVVVAAHRWLAERTTRRGLATAIVVGAGFIALLPATALHRPVAISGTPEFLRSYDALRWLSTDAARPGNPLRPATRPRFAVLSRWQWGHWVTQVGRQANIANPLGQTPTNLRGVRRSVRAFLESDPPAMLQRLERLGARYVLATPLLEELPRIVHHTEWRRETFIAPGTTRLLPRFFRTLNARLLHYDARRFSIGGAVHAPLRRLRLVFESSHPHDELGRRFSYAKVFERVAAARVRGVTRADADVRARLEVLTNVGRRFVYRDRARADAAGRFTLAVPYATGKNGAVRGSALELRAGSRAVRIKVANADVTEGRDVVAPRF